MEKILLYIVKSIVKNEESVAITDQSDSETLHYSINVDTPDTPCIIGKGGKTIKAITDIVTVYQRKMQSDDRRRIYLTVAGNELLSK